MKLDKRICKVFLRILIGGHDSAVRKGWFMTADNDGINAPLSLESFKFTQGPLGLLFDLFFRQRREIRIEQNQSDILPDEAIPTFLFEVGEPCKIVIKGSFIAPVKLMISKDWKKGNLLFTEFFMKIIKLLPVLLRAAASGQISKVDDKGGVAPGDFINDSFALPIISFSPEFPVTRTLRISHQNEMFFRRIDFRKTSIEKRRHLPDLFCLGSSRQLNTNNETYDKPVNNRFPDPRPLLFAIHFKTFHLRPEETARTSSQRHSTSTRIVGALQRIPVLVRL